VEETPIEIFRKRKARGELLEVVKAICEGYQRGAVDRANAFYSLLGLAYYHIVPLTPMDIRKIREAFV